MSKFFALLLAGLVIISPNMASADACTGKDCDKKEAGTTTTDTSAEDADASTQTQQ